MKKTRLQKVVDHLRKARIQIVKDKAPWFNMSTWGKLKAAGEFKGKKNLECVTSACAIGHAAHLFKGQGFHLELDPDNYDTLIPVYKKLQSFEAIAAFFDIGVNDAEYLFHPGQYSDPQNITVSEVADRIENFIHGIEE